jgi:hypothetical protein
MFFYFIALFWALITPTSNQANTHTSTGNGYVTTMDDDGDSGDTGGETGTIPPKPPKP